MFELQDQKINSIDKYVCFNLVFYQKPTCPVDCARTNESFSCARPCRRVSLSRKTTKCPDSPTIDAERAGFS